VKGRLPFAEGVSFWMAIVANVAIVAGIGEETFDVADDAMLFG